MASSKQLLSQIEQEINHTGTIGLRIRTLAARLEKANNLVKELGNELVVAHGLLDNEEKAEYVANVVAMHQQLDQ